MEKMLDMMESMANLSEMPKVLSAAFKYPLSFQEEVLLHDLEEDLGKVVHVKLERALAGDTMIALTESDRKNIKELNAIRKAIKLILSEKGLPGANEPMSN